MHSFDNLILSVVSSQDFSLPPKGRVSDAEKNTIFSRGLLNDVATCFLIKGRSAENLRRKDAAKHAYAAATKYKHARCWDLKGWFWSPAEMAADLTDHYDYRQHAFAVQTIDIEREVRR